MARKMFIVARGNERLFRSLRSAIGDEPDVEIFYDRRQMDWPQRRPPEERRVPSDVEERIRTIGFAVVRPESHQPGGIIRWSP